MQEIAEAIHYGAMAFLRRQYRTLIIFVLALIVVFCVVGFVTTGPDSMKPQTAIAFAVGDPLKDTSGPSLNILIKLMTIIALVFAPLF